MKWRKLGRVFAPDGSLPWARTHAHVPTAMLMGNFIRIYFAGFDKEKIKRIGFADVQADDPTRIIAVSQEPVLNIGEPGTFDESGVVPSFVLNHDGIWLYYFGWQLLGGDLPRYLFAGLAISRNEGRSFERYSQVPILERNDEERFIRSTVSILKEKRGGFEYFRCWYASSNRLIDINGNIIPSYTIKYLESNNGVYWPDEGKLVMDFVNEKEFAFVRPWIIEEQNKYKMWYSIRRKNKGYIIGYAESKDGIEWTRKDGEVGIEKSEEGWDSEMICFPSIVDAEGKRYMFYNGNNYGETGFGVAILEKD